MSARAKSFRNVLVDSVYLTLLMAAAATTLTHVARGAESRIVQTADAAAVARPSDDHLDSRLNTDDNLPSGNPSESPEAKREATLLGMTLFERSSGDVRVTDVAATSPAWDAGIRSGDRIQSLDGLKPKRLSSWIEDIGKILKDTKDGHSVSAKVEREGETLDLRIMVPVSNLDQARDARKAEEEKARARMWSRNQRQMPQGQSGGTPAGYATDDRYVDDGIGYGGYGLGGFFDNDAPSSDTDNGDDRMATSAVARLMAVNTLRGDASGNPQSSGGEVGMAQFQNVGEGVNAMVTVRGLPQGTYRVGIGEGIGTGTSGTAGFNPIDQTIGGVSPALQGTTENSRNSNVDRNRNGSNADERNPNTRGRNQNANPMQNQQQPGFTPRPNAPVGTTPDAGGAPVGAGGAPVGTGGTPSGTGDGASIANPSSAYLAQQLDPQQQPVGTTGPVGATPQTQQPVGTANQPNSAQRTPQTQTYDPRANAENQRQRQNNGLPANSPMGSPFVAEIGTLQVGPDGTGRVENRFEGITVRNLAGMSVMVESTNWLGRTGVQTDPRLASNRQAQSQTQPPRRNGQQPIQESDPMTRGAQGIVASGVIRLRNSGDVANAPQQ